MRVEEWIDAALARGDNVPPSDAAYVERRRRALELGLEVRDEVWNATHFPWKVRTVDLVVPASQGYVAVPENYDELGPYGELYLMQGGIVQVPPLEQKPEHEIHEARTGNNPTDTPAIFAIFGQDPVSFLDLIQLPINSTQLTLRLAYMKKPPTLRDAGDPDETPGAQLTADDAALQEIPSRFHVSVLLVGLKAKLRESKGDARWRKLEADYQKGITTMKEVKARFASSHRRPPSFFGPR